MEFTCATVMKNATLLDSHTLLSYLVCFAMVFLCCGRTRLFPPVVDMRWEHAAKTRFCRNLTGPYFEVVLIIVKVLESNYVIMSRYFNVLVSKEEEKLTRNKSADVVLNSTHDTLPRPAQRLNRLC